MTNESDCRTDSRAPKTRLNRYSVGRQIHRRRHRHQDTVERAQHRAVTGERDHRADQHLAGQPGQPPVLHHLLPDALSVTQDPFDHQ
jgi:hypothetical protein